MRVLKRNENIKIKGHLKSSLRKKSSEINYQNLMTSNYMLDSDYMFSEYLELKRKKVHQTKRLIIQIILNLLLLTIYFHHFELNLLFEISLISILIFLNFLIIWFFTLK